MLHRTVLEPHHDVPVVDEADVLVCGGGPAGVAAAVTAARTGARTTLLEVQGCLGGVWTSGALSLILESNKHGFLDELTERLEVRQGHAVNSPTSLVYDVETMKVVLDDIMLRAGVRVRFHTRVAGVIKDANNHPVCVLTESKSGREAWSAKVFVDATGDGDLSAQAGCGFDYGDPESGHGQPMSLMALLTGIVGAEVERFVAGGLAASTEAQSSRVTREAKANLLNEFRRAGTTPSYTGPSLWRVHDSVFALMANHEYDVRPFEADEVTKATRSARSEVHELVDSLRALGRPWTEVRIAATAAQIGVREGRRIHGRYTVTYHDLLNGQRHPDAICRVTSGADVHALRAAEGGHLSQATRVLNNVPEAHNSVAQVRPYDIPLRALIAKDVDRLLLAGRCISGDFLAHSSYRVTGNAVSMGEAAGVLGALAASSGIAPQDVPWAAVEVALTEARMAVPGRGKGTGE